jgi:lipopolysaccharide export LptBFGC system permease protein LptF
MTMNVMEAPKEKKLEKKAREMTIRELREELKKLGQEGIEPEPFLTEIHQKIAISFSALVFVLIAIPLAIKSHVKEKSISLGISLAVLVIYWLFLAGGTAFALKGNVAPWFAMWLPNMLIGSTGIAFFCLILKR